MRRGSTSAGQATASAVFMDTLVTIEVIEPHPAGECRERIDRALGWFGEVERRCSRFDATSELSTLSAATVGRPVKPSALVFKLVEFAVAVAEESDGAFDPTVGCLMQIRGFDRNFRTGERMKSRADASPARSYRDIDLDRQAGTVTLRKPLVLDLGAVAKGLAIDLAAEELECYSNYAINAGGDVFVRGRNASHAPWRLGIRHPREVESLIDVLVVSDSAVCTSGDYERPRRDGGPGHHIIAPKNGESPVETVSATVIAPSAMVADALSTAALVMTPGRAIEFLENQGVEGLIISADMSQRETARMSEYRR